MMTRMEMMIARGTGRSGILIMVRLVTQIKWSRGYADELINRAVIKYKSVVFNVTDDHSGRGVSPHLCRLNSCLNSWTPISATASLSRASSRGIVYEICKGDYVTTID